MMKSNFAPVASRRIGFVSTRFESNDGVSLETEKWVTVLERLGHSCYFFAGTSDWAEDRTMVVPVAHFKDPEIQEINAIVFSKRKRPPEVTRKIHLIKDHLKEKIADFVRRYDIEVLIVENALAIPMNIPLGMALTEYIAETGMLTIAHHHDFFWERKRFLVNCVWDYLNMAFPPHLPTIRHVVINSSGANQLSLRTGISAKIIPNVMDFDNPPSPPDAYTSQLREDMGLNPEDYFLLQPTRIVQRKGIEHAIELVQRLGVDSPLIISHAGGDEGNHYQEHLRHYADLLGVRVHFASDRVADRRGLAPDGRKIYRLWDLYPFADLVTYPSSLEGFGNAFLEAIYFRRPILVNNYSIFDIDIKPKGFQVIEFEGFVTQETVNRVRQILQNPELGEEMGEHNYRVGQRHYSYTTLERHLHTVLMECFGEELEPRD